MLSLEIRAQIVMLRDMGMPLKEIAKRFHVSRSRISQITLYERVQIAAYMSKKKEWENAA